MYRLHTCVLAMKHGDESQREWQSRMQDRSLEYGESVYALSLIIEQSAVCDPCREDKHDECTKVAKDVFKNQPTHCWCEVCKGAWL